MRRACSSSTVGGRGGLASRYQAFARDFQTRDLAVDHGNRVKIAGDQQFGSLFAQRGDLCAQVGMRLRQHRQHEVVLEQILDGGRLDPLGSLCVQRLARQKTTEPITQTFRHSCPPRIRGRG
jgi:hypothetical protein